MTSGASRNLALPFLRRARARPRRTALVVGGKSWSYGALAEESARVAAWLGLRAGRVGVLAARSLETYAGILGAARAGWTYVPLNPKQPAARLEQILRRARLDAVVADAAGEKHLRALRAVLPPRVLLGRAPAARRSPPAFVPASAPAYILFTSGTTGEPKGVLTAAGGVARYLARVQARYRFVPEDRFGQFFETSFDVSAFEMFACWGAGASLHVLPEAALMAPAAFIRARRLTVWAAVPSVIAMLARLKHLTPRSLPSLRVSFFAGEGLTVASARAWRAAAPNGVVDNQYGPTEATITCLCQRLEEPPAETAGRGMLAIGRPYAGMRAAIVGPGGRFLTRPDAEGELALSGPQLALGYLDEPALTARRFPRLAGARWYLTGDLARRDRAGRFHHLGRVDNQIKVRGYRVELEEVEAWLRRAAGTQDVAAVAWPVSEGRAEGIAAFVAGAAAPPAAIRAELARRLPAYMIPRRILALRRLPRSPNGKLDRARLIALLEG